MNYVESELKLERQQGPKSSVSHKSILRSGVISDRCRDLLRVQHCHLAFFELGQVIVYLKGRKVFTGLSFWKELSWILIDTVFFLSVTSGPPWGQTAKEKEFC